MNGGGMRIIFRGTVQGVGFRPAVYRTATALGLRGTVRNDGSQVTVDISDGELFLNVFRKNVPPLARVDSIERYQFPIDPSVEDFTIVPSGSGGAGVSIPADTAICPECLHDMRYGKRENYPFTSCTNCGPRFTLLSSLPYDRGSTAMDGFHPCQGCSDEYSDPHDRRFHHQTVCCPACGPSYYLIDGSGERIECDDPISKFAEMLRGGNIGIAKSWGGMHICCTMDNIAKMRSWYHREQKPFAVMVKDADHIKKFGKPTDLELAHLRSPQRPIVLVGKVESKVTELVSPGLDNIGLFLPYSGMQHLLFDALKEDALIMTSANVPGEPMVLGDSDVMELGADMYLLHNQPIINRADDSVLRMIEGNTSFIRKSRGHIPSYLSVEKRGCVAAVGAQENLAGAVASDGRIYPTQHIGNGEGIGVPEYLEQAMDFQMSLLQCTPQVVACDLHPGYVNRKYAKVLAERSSAELVEVQHHWAHAASFMAEHGYDETVCLTLDGTGHGDDGNAWGGEVLYSTYENYKRLAHLEYIPLLGSERALYDLRRLGFAVDMINGTENTSFTDSESSVLQKLSKNSVRTSSMGRFLDTISYKLGICTQRTYDGEPAMKLEPYLARGTLIPGFETVTEDRVVKTADLFSCIEPSMKKEDVAYSMVHSVMEELVSAAVSRAQFEGISKIGITGGVSYNAPICRMFWKLVRDAGCKPRFHNKVPNGDAGISTGQAMIALNRL